MCGSIFLADGPMNLKASGFSQCSVGWGPANREDKISSLISSSMSNVGQEERFFQTSKRVLFVDVVHPVVEGIGGTGFRSDQTGSSSLSMRTEDVYSVGI